MNRPHLPASIAAPQQHVQPAEEVSDLWAVLQALPRPHRTVPFPRNLQGTDTPAGEVAIWPLTQEEQMACNAEADRFTKKLMKDPQQREQANLGYHHTYTNETAVQVLFRACRDVKDLKRSAFPSPTLLRSVLTTEEVGVLFNHYITVRNEVGPIVAWMSPEELEGMILRLQTAGSAYPFDTLSWEQQQTLVLSMASRLVSCWMAMSSAGLPLDATTYLLGRLEEMRADQAKADQTGTPQAGSDGADDTDGPKAPDDPQNDAGAPATPQD